jgi:hypothetical protein
MKSPNAGGDRYQLLPPLTDAEFASLKTDIALHGVLVPVVIDADSGEVIDGHHRVKAWTELRSEKIAVADYPREVRRFEDDEARVTFVLAANLFRRHLTRAQRAEVVARLRQLGWSLRRVSGAIGVHHETVRRDLEGVADATSDVETIVGRDQKTYPARRVKPAPSIIVKSARDEGCARAALSALGEEAPAGLLGLTRAENGRASLLLLGDATRTCQSGLKVPGGRSEPVTFVKCSSISLTGRLTPSSATRPITAKGCLATRHFRS